MLSPNFYIKTEESSNSFARFILEPLHSSFGNSMGNALRRTLLSSLPGASIGYVKVAKAPHLFSTVDGVKESVLDIILNLKKLKFSAAGEGSFKVSLSAKGPGKVYAKDLEGEAKVVNGDAYIAEITTEKGSLEIEAIVETGYGYIPSEEKETKETGFITIDSSFSPVQRVNFKVEEARVGRKTNFERLILEVWTDESISPEDAVKQAAEILANNFTHISSGNTVAAEGEKAEATEQEKEDAKTHSKMYETIIDELNLPSRVINALLRENIETVADLVKRGKENLVGLKGVGRKSIDLIEDELEKMGVELK